MMKKMLTISLVLFSLTAIDACTQKNSEEPTTEKPPNPAHEVTLHIQGMACELCAQSLESSLSELKGITIHEIDPEKGLAKISFQENIPEDEQIKNTVENAGFNLKIKEEQSSSSKDSNR